MKRKVIKGRLDHKHEEDSAAAPPENMADSCFSGDEVNASPRKRRGINKKIVTVKIGLSRSKGEVCPPPDSWSWRKYGQKPIKGSPYPRGYYRCSSWKGCPVRKQVERSRLDPTTLVITYSYDHNHPIATAVRTQNHFSPAEARAASVAGATVATSPSSSTTTTDDPEASFPPEECVTYANEPDTEPAGGSFIEFSSEFGWVSGMESTIIDGISVAGPNSIQSDVGMLSILLRILD